MVPPTGVTDSVHLTLRHRNGVPSVDQYYGTLKSVDGRARKSIGDRWKVGRSSKTQVDGHMIETPHYMVHPDYFNKYGTLSGTGVLTKSIRCAETWLYGTVGVRGSPSQRPSLFLYPGVLAPPPRVVSQSPYGVMPPPGTYYQQARYQQQQILPEPRICQCSDYGKDSRKGVTSSCRKCGGRRSAASTRTTATKTRPRLMDMTVQTHQEKQKSSASPNAADPYNLMRKSRLGVGDATETSIINPKSKHRRVRTRSSSPLRGRRTDENGPSFETFKPKQSDNEEMNWRLGQEEHWSNDEEEDTPQRRRSILEYGVNVYDLNRKSSGHGRRDETDESSDELSDGTLQVKTKMKILRPKLLKTDLKQRKISIPDPEKLKSLNDTSKTEVRLSGQRFRIFDHSSPSTPSIEGYMSDETSADTSPKRPPRRLKDRSDDETNLRFAKLKSKSSPNLSIKSILKKPPGEETPEESTVVKPVLDLRGSPSFPEPEDRAAFKKQLQNTLKKKKQVQFKVSSSESLTDRETEVSQQCETEEEQVVVEGGSVRKTQSCEDLLMDSGGREEEPQEAGDLDRKTPEEDGVTRHEAAGSRDDDVIGTHQVSTLKRSFSDRRPSSATVVLKDDVLSLSTSPPNSYLFNDTMALRPRNTRFDSRDIFIDENGRMRMGEEPQRAVARPRPREPPPPPPPPPPPANVITYAEFEKLSGQHFKVRSPPDPPPRQIFPFVVNTPRPGDLKPAQVQVPCNNRNSEPVHVVTMEGVKGKTVKLCDNCESGMKLSPVLKEPPNKSPERKTIVKVNGKDGDAKPTSILITPTQIADRPVRTSSVIVNTFPVQDQNKVTISVTSSETVPGLSSCTIIETGSNSTVIPVVSADNKTTLIVGSHTPIKEPDKPTPYIFSSVTPETDMLLENMDPVEAVRRNLVPHICGKDDAPQTLMDKIKQSRDTKEQKSLKMISQLFTKAPPPEESVVTATAPAESLLATYQSRKALGTWKTTTSSQCQDSSATTSRSNSFCSSNSLKNSSVVTSRSSSFCSTSYKSPDSDYDTNPFLPISIARSKFYIMSDGEDSLSTEKDKLEDEYEIRPVGLTEEKKKLGELEEVEEEEVENIYETIKEPIYDQIVKLDHEESDDDTPPPLPLTLPPSLEDLEAGRATKSIFEGASKYDILSYLVDAKDRVQEDPYFGGSSASEDTDSRRLCSLDDGERTSLDSAIHCRTPSDGLDTEVNLQRMESCQNTSLGSDSGVDLSSRISHLSHASDSSEDNLILPSVADREANLKLNRKSSAEIERNDSGVGSETSQSSRSKWQVSGNSIREDPQHLCEDCDQMVETQVTDSGVMYAPLVCRKCSKKRSERKEIIQEITETEEKYGRDLKIILEEFYKPMLVAGLLTADQLTAIFLNTEELLDNNEQLTEKLRDTLEIALEQGDEDLLTVNIGKLFLEAGPMLHAFESYCTRQGSAAVLLASLEKEKELLRIFLRVSQMENSVLRRMNLNSFLMVPVQRVTKYPLLLARLLKVTPMQHESRDQLREAQHNIELHLEHMNSEAKDVSATKVWRRFSTSATNGRKSTAELEMTNIKLRKMAVDVLEWNHEEVRFVLEGKLLFTQPTDGNWKRGRTLKLTPIFVLLVTLGKPNSKYKTDPKDDELAFPAKTGVREATLLLVKEKCGRYSLIREPLFLDKIIVCCETETEDYFEVQELSTKETFLFKSEEGDRTREWYRQLQYHAQILGAWRRRRNALANIMINGMTARAYVS